MDLQNPALLAGVIGMGALALRVGWALGKPKLKKLPPELRPLVSLGMSGAIGFLTALAGGAAVEQAVIVGLGVFTASEGTLRVQKGRARRLAAKGALGGGAS